MQATRLVRALGVAAAAFTAACSDQSSPLGNSGPAPSAALASVQGSDRHVIEVKAASKQAVVDAIVKAGGKVERSMDDIGLLTVRGLGANASQIASQAGVVSVVPDLQFQWIQPTDKSQQVQADAGLTASGKDQSSAFFYNKYQWYLRVTDANKAWVPTPAGAGVEVCVLDTGVDPTHIDLAGKIDIARSRSFVASEPTTEDFEGHGTFVSSLISGNGLGMASVAPAAKLCMLKVLNKDGRGSFGDLISALYYVGRDLRDVDAINMSLGAYVDLKEDGVRELVRDLTKAVIFVRSRGILVIASSGNSGINLDEDPPTMLSIPAQIPGVTSIGATAPVNQQNFDLLASYSNYGGRTGIAMVAPGGDLVTGGDLRDLILGACAISVCGSHSGYLLGAGTSFASPLVAGAAAVVESNLAGNQTPGRLFGCLAGNADNIGKKEFFGFGRLNVLNAANCPKTADD
jgi:subtilisin family serine protease